MISSFPPSRSFGVRHALIDLYVMTGIGEKNLSALMLARSPQIILAGFMTMQYNLLTGTYPDRSCSDNFLTNKWTMEDSGRPTVRYSVIVE